MTRHNVFKRTLAGILAVLTVAVYLPANVGTGGIFGGTAIVASAVEIKSETLDTHTKDTTEYTGENIQIEGAYCDKDGFDIGVNSNRFIAIKTLNGANITKVEMVCGLFGGADVSQTNTTAGTLSIPDSFGRGSTLTIDGVNENSLKITYTGDNVWLQFNKITVYYEDVALANVTSQPTANTLTYDGTEQELVTAGEAKNGTMQYKLGADGTYSNEIPKATDAGTYTVYYKAVGNEGYDDSAEASVNVTIQKADSVIKTKPQGIENLTYTGENQALITTNGEAEGGTLQYKLLNYDDVEAYKKEYSTVSEEWVIALLLYLYDNQGWQDTIPKATDKGKYVVGWRVQGDENHKDCPDTSEVGSRLGIIANYYTSDFYTVVEIADKPTNLTLSNLGDTVVTDSNNTEITDTSALTGGTYYIYTNKSIADSDATNALNLGYKKNQTYNGTKYQYRYEIEVPTVPADGYVLSHTNNWVGKVEIKPDTEYSIFASIESKTYDGKAVIPTSYLYKTTDETKTPVTTIQGVKTNYTYYSVNGDKLTELDNAPKDAGTYRLEVSKTAKGYTFDNYYVDFKIEQKEIAVTPNATGKIFGEADPDFTDFSYDESAIIAGETLTFTGEYGLNNYEGNVGTYPIDSPQLVTLRTIQFYTVTFAKGALPMRKRDTAKPFSWTNDSELDKILELNQKINSGATLETFRKEFADLEKSVFEKEKALQKAETDLKTFYDLREKIQIVFEGKKSEIYSPEQAQQALKAYPHITRENYHNIEMLIESETRKFREAEKVYMTEKEKLQKADELLSAAEKVMGGTYVQSLVGEERKRRESQYIPNGLKSS